MARFSVYLGRLLVQDFFFEKGPVLIGRAPDAEILLENPTVSRRHAQIDRHGREWSVQDLGGRNGLFVNGAYINMQMLKDGDRVDIGKYTIVFSTSNTAPAQEPPAAVNTSPGQSLDDVMSLLETVETVEVLLPDNPRFTKAADVVTVPIAVSDTARARAQQAMATAGSKAEPSNRASSPVTRALVSRGAPEERREATAALSLDYIEAQLEKRQIELQPHLAWTDVHGKAVLTPLDVDETLIGNDASLPVHVRAGVPGVKVYAAVRRQDGAFLVEPRSRLITVKLNGRAIAQSTPLGDGARLEVGTATVVFHAALKR